MHRPEDDAASTTVLLKTAKIESNYGALLFDRLYTVISQIGRSFGSEETSEFRHLAV